MNKYTDARYPEKINDLIDNEGGLSEEGQAAVAEGVNKAIEGGDIPLPPAGTKLYMHDCGWLSFGGPVNQILVINFDPTPLTFDFFYNSNGSIGMAEEDKYLIIKVCQSGSNHYLPSYEGFAGNGKRMIIYNASGDKQEYPIASGQTINDKVTSL